MEANTGLAECWPTALSGRAVRRSTLLPQGSSALPPWRRSGWIHGRACHRNRAGRLSEKRGSNQTGSGTTVEACSPAAALSAATSSSTIATRLAARRRIPAASRGTGSAPRPDGYRSHSVAGTRRGRVVRLRVVLGCSARRHCDHARGEADSELAGGAHVTLSAEAAEASANAGMLSPAGKGWILFAAKDGFSGSERRPLM